ncbi:hypothetical protein [Pontibacillus litoralis]|uniref:DUF8042 domain-containing protein n=1 Tax=Pontibacillus litoralis JSM 072002 TaxID=1385512 RepID=A0A0A5G572_9BACI|nr:hypothetical protein [Pontibacillus litoralis]KGX86303.1 hypothetical protein N784_04975 [Pontibacillus litoralis JSM 072002]
MNNLTAEQQIFIKQYTDLLVTIGEGLEYIERNLINDVSPQVDVVFSDIISALQQINRGNQTISKLFTDSKEELEKQFNAFQQLVQLMSSWFEKQSNHDKRDLIQQHVTPQFENWHHSMNALIDPYIVR